MLIRAAFTLLAISLYVCGESSNNASAASTTESANAPPLMPADIASIMEKFEVITKEIKKVQERAVTVSKLIEQVESVGNDTLTRVDDSEKVMVAMAQRAKDNPSMIKGLRNSTEDAGLKVQGVLADMKALMKVVEKMDEAATPEGVKAGEVAKDEAELEHQVKRLVPTKEGGINSRIENDGKTLTQFQERVDKGIEGLVEKRLRGHFKKARETIRDLRYATLADKYEEEEEDSKQSASGKQM